MAIRATTKGDTFFHRSRILQGDRDSETTSLDPQCLWRIGIQTRSTFPLHWQSRHNVSGFKSCSGRMNKTHLYSWTLHPWSSGAWRNQVILHSHQSAVCRHLHKEPWKTEIPRGKKSSLTFKIQNVIRWTSRRSVGNPGISYSDLILIPGSRVIFSWSLLHYSYYEGPDPYLWRCYDIMGLDSYLLSMVQELHHMISLSRYTLLANGLYPSYRLSGLCIRLYPTSHTCTNSTEQYIRLALQPVSIRNYLILVSSSSELWAHSHYAQITPLS